MRVEKYRVGKNRKYFIYYCRKTIGFVEITYCGISNVLCLIEIKLHVKLNLSNISLNDSNYHIYLIAIGILLIDCD